MRARPLGRRADPQRVIWTTETAGYTEDGYKVRLFWGPACNQWILILKRPADDSDSQSWARTDERIEYARLLAERAVRVDRMEALGPDLEADAVA